MINLLRGRREQGRFVAADAVHAVQYLEALGCEEPALLAYHPVGRVNPFQACLYGGLWDRGIAPLPLHRIDNLDALSSVMDRGVPTILHLHWIVDVLEAGSTEAAARARVADYLDRLDRFSSAGGKLMWTVHNILPHDTPYPRLAAELQQEIADRCALVHVLNRGTSQAVAEHFVVPADRAAHVPHPNYVGAYPDFLTRHQARFDLGLAPDEIVYAAVGSIHPYKGVGLLLDAFDLVGERSDAPRRLIVAGAPADAAELEDVLDRCQRHPRVIFRPRMIPDNEMQVYMRACDIAVLPYRRSLNSGVLLLALSFGVPLVAPRFAAVTELVTPEMARTFEPNDVESLAEAMLAADELVDPAARRAARRVADQFDRRELAAAFADLAAGLLKG